MVDEKLRRYGIEKRTLELSNTIAEGCADGICLSNVEMGYHYGEMGYQYGEMEKVTSFLFCTTSV